MEETSTFWVGASCIQETPNLKKICEDEDFVSFVNLITDHETDEDKAVIHVHYKTDIDQRIINKSLEVMALIDESMKERGLDKLYTWAETDEQERFNRYLGFSPTGREVYIQGYYIDHPIYEYVKEL